MKCVVQYALRSMVFIISSCDLQSVVMTPSGIVISAWLRLNFSSPVNGRLLFAIMIQTQHTDVVKVRHVSKNLLASRKGMHSKCHAKSSSGVCYLTAPFALTCHQQKLPAQGDKCLTQIKEAAQEEFDCSFIPGCSWEDVIPTSRHQQNDLGTCRLHVGGSAEGE